ncbi:bile acid:sodium symporter family protein [Sphingomonas sp. Leaf343]|uniref:bile acid:sodium symporter family protein n=1 Tax=Sphingomonas sp. Leaf343 TaxID=1736345 RepID=UPI0006FC7D72|nr:bile acid:sodium symporter family protein [Sphingomonas sp. Leaf343]KQR87398.1 bile acid:sodium symporter [Sphingomonas sp. Leaf343]
MFKRIDRYSLLLIATVVLASVLPCRGVVATVLGYATEGAIALLFFLHGAKLSRAAIVQGLTNWRLHLLVLAITFALFPMFGLAAHGVAGQVLAPSLASGLLFLTLLPSTVQSSIAFTSIARGNVPAAVCSASASNLLGILFTPLLVALLMAGQAGGAGGVSGDEVWTIVFQLLVPFVAGHLSRPLTAGFVERRKAMLSYVDRGSILLVVYTAFSAAVVEGLWTRVPVWQLALVFLFCALLLAAAMLTTSALTRRLKFDRADAIAILFCGSKKSLAAGVPMAGVLFSPAEVGAVILPLMIFHQLQLLVCANLAQRHADTAPREEDVEDAVIAS